MSKKTSCRIEWLDVAKGIVIMLMVLGHTGIPMQISNIIFSFHMPFFFVASGITTNFEKYPFSQFSLKKLKTLGIPFIIYSVINMIFWPMIKGESHVDYTLDIITKGWGGVALWFIPVLFFALMLTRAVYSIRNKYTKYVIISILPIVSGLLCHFKILLPWNLSVVPFSAFFVLAGDFCKRYTSTISSLKEPRWYWFVIALSVTICVSQVWRLDMACNSVLPIIPKTIAALCGCYCVAKLSLFISNKIKNVSGILQVVGRETYVILAFSQIIIFSANTYLKLGVVGKYLLLIAGLVLIVMFKNKIVDLSAVSLKRR